MVNARLHLICGNCGSNNDWEYEIEPEGNDIDGVIFPDVHIWCRNCSTLHTFDEVKAKDITKHDKIICEYKK